MNVAIITARKGSKSIINKNIYPVYGKPLIAYPLEAAINAKLIDKVYVSTDCEEIMKISINMNCEIIERPQNLQGDDVNHGDVIQQSVSYVDKMESNLKNIVLLLGNTVMISSSLIDKSLTILNDNLDYDSVMSVWEAADDHPLRALEIKDGLLKTYGDSKRSVSTNRQSYPKAYYYDQGVWTFRKSCAFERKGPNPWWWMGEKSYPIIREWVTGRDIHSQFDLSITKWWIKEMSDFKN